VNGRYAIMENIAAPGTATPMHFHAEDEIFNILEGTVTFSIDGDVFNASVGSIVVIPAGAHHAWRNRSNAPIRMLTFFSPGGVEELYPKLVGLSLEELSAVVEPFGSGIVGPPFDE
jgi:quercetin dioxygenase-like cupin family protein